MKDLARKLNGQVDAWTSAIDAILPVWDKVEQIYNVDPSAVNLNVVDGLSTYCYSIYTAKVDKLVGDLTGSLTSPSPMVQVIKPNNADEVSHSVERALDYVLTSSGFKRILSLALLRACNTNIGPVRIFPVSGENGITKFDCEWYDSRDFLLYPSNATRIEDAVTVGHRFYESKDSILRKIKAGIYKGVGDRAIPTTESADEYTEIPGQWDVLANVTQYECNDDVGAECFDCITWVDGERRRVVFIRDTDIVLVDEPYPYDYSWYAVLRLTRAEKKIICNGSLGTKVADYVLQHSDLNNAIMGGALWSAFPPTYSIGAVGSINIKHISPGELIELPAGTEIGVLPTPFNPALIMPMIGQLEGMIEQVLGISAISTGKMPGQETKATTINVLAANDQRRQASYLDAVSEGIEDISRIALQYLQLHYDQLSDYMKACLPPELAEDESWRDTSYILEVTGKSGDSNPEVLFARLQMILSMAANPATGLDVQKVAKEAIRAINLPIPLDRLYSDENSQILQVLNELKKQGINPESVIAAGVNALAAEIEAGSRGIPNGPGLANDAEDPSQVMGNQTEGLSPFQDQRGFQV
jgi:hypothetical protein